MLKNPAAPLLRPQELLVVPETACCCNEQMLRGSSAVALSSRLVLSHD